MSEFAIVLLVLVAFMEVVGLVGMIGLRKNVQDIDKRVTMLEARQENAVTSRDVAGLLERQANQEGQLRTMLDLLRAIQKHMLENDQ